MVRKKSSASKSKTVNEEEPNTSLLLKPLRTKASKERHKQKSRKITKSRIHESKARNKGRAPKLALDLLTL